MKNVLWFSRHSMTVSQQQDIVRILGPISVTQVSGSPTNVHVEFEGLTPEEGRTQAETILTGPQPPLKELVKGFDEVAVVLPIGMLQQLLPFSQSGRLLQAISKRILLDGGKVEFAHEKWQAVTEVKIVTEDL
jgi:hypothetical protein